MKDNIHPKYYPKAEVTCNCGAKFYVGSTTSKMEVEVCSHCHPFYTGKSRTIDTTGKVQRFKKRLDRTMSMRKNALKKTSKTHSKNKEEKIKEKKASGEIK